MRKLEAGGYKGIVQGSRLTVKDKGKVQIKECGVRRARLDLPGGLSLSNGNRVEVGRKTAKDTLTTEGYGLPRKYHNQSKNSV
jgi:hypothetical protein